MISTTQILEVEKLVYQGFGLGRVNDKVYFVDGALEGDLVQFAVTAEHRTYGLGRMTKVLRPSPYRVTSPCPFSDACGGCPWMSLHLDRQLYWKQAIISEHLQKISSVSLPPINLTPSPQSLNYRSRITLRCHVDQNGQLSVGYFKRNSHELIPITHCQVAVPAINHFIETVKTLKLPQLSRQKFRFELQYLPIVGSDKCDSLLVQVIPAQKNTKHLDDLCQAIAQVNGVKYCRPVSERHSNHSEEYFPYIKKNHLTYYTNPGQFQQVNIEANAKLQDWVKLIVVSTGAKTIIDLYSGSGNFCLELAESGRQILGIEENPLSVATGNYNVRANHLDCIKFIRNDVAHALPDLVTKNAPADLVIMDPPRAGMKNLMGYFTHWRPNDIIYISCDPTSLVRDLAELLSLGYHLKELQAYDFFPQTFHVETAVWLENRNK